MLTFIIIGTVLFYLLYLVRKYIIRPYLRMRQFSGIKGVYLLPFMPVVGAFQLAQKSFEQHGDENYFAKIAYETYPGCRTLITNVLEKVFVIITDPQLLKDYYLNEKNYIKDRFFIQNRIRVFGDGVAFAEGKQWAKQRKIMSSVFHFDFFQSFIPKIMEIVQSQLRKLADESTKNNIIEINSLQFCSTIAGKTVVKSFFGIQFNQPIKNLDLTVFLLRLVSKVGAQQRTLRHFLFGPSILKLGIFKIDKEINQEVRIFRALTKQAINKKIAEFDENSNKDKNGNLLSTLIQKKLIDTEQGLSKDKLCEQFLTLFIAGTDTTSHLMGMLLYYLSIHIQIQQKLCQQLKTLQRQKLNYKSINSLKYLQKVIKQTFRHYDYMVSTFPRVALKDHKLGDLSLKKGDVIMPGWAQLNYHPQIFPNPHQFNPQRWTQAQKKQNIDMVFSPFSNGIRSCLGKHFALLETKIMVYCLLQKYNIKLKQGYIHLLKTGALYEPANPIMLELETLVGRK